MSTHTPRSRLWPLALSALFIIVAGVSLLFLSRRSSSSAEQPSLQLALLPPASVAPPTSSRVGFALAPDGRRLVFSGSANGVSQLWLRDLSSDDVQPLPHTIDGVRPFWAPDGAAFGFFASGKLRVFVFADGSARDVADAPSPHGAAWHPNGDIVFAPSNDGPLMRRQPDGAIEPFTVLDGARENSHGHPSISADGRTIIFFVAAQEPTRHGIWIAPYDNASARQRLVRSDAHGIWAEQTLLYSTEGALVAQRVDPESRRLDGRSLLLGTAVGRSEDHDLYATVGGDTLIFGSAPSQLRELRWVDRAGGVLARLGEPMAGSDVRVAPGGASVAVSRVDRQLNTLDIWIYEGDRPLPRRLSLAIDADDSPAWSRDGQRLVWVAGRHAITIRDADAGTPERTLAKLETAVATTDWPDERWIVMTQSRRTTRNDVVLWPAEATDTPRDYAATSFNEMHGVVSPDGRWLAYASDESGEFDVYVDSFPTPSRRARLSVGGGMEPRWSTTGSEIFFRRGGEVHVVRLQFARGDAEAVASEKLFDAGGDIRSFDVTPEGDRFLLNVPAPDSGPKPMTAIVNLRSRLAALFRP